MTTRNIAGMNPHDYDHRHANISGGWLRASVFGGMDGLVTNIGLVTGIGAAGAPAPMVVIAGIAGMVAGAFSMALGEYTSVRTQNEQLDSEVRIEREAQERNPHGERRELVRMLVDMGMSNETARTAADEIHENDETALRVHLTQELGLDPDAKPSPLVAAASSFVFFSFGAIIPLLPYLFGTTGLLPGLIVGGLGLILAGGLAARFSRQGMLRNALRQLILGALAVTASYLVGLLLGVSVTG